MVAGRLAELRGQYYVVLSYTDPVTNKRRQPWIATGLPVKGNKKKAEQFLLKTRKEFDLEHAPARKGELSPNMLFADFMEMWLKVIKNSVAQTTFSSYTMMVTKKIAPYFRKKGILLKDLTASQIQDFYIYEQQTVSANTVIHEHANIHKALKYAVKLDLIPSNPADKIERPKKEAPVVNYYNLEELNRFFEACKGHRMELLFQMTAFYGFRRSEVIGLKWDAIDFNQNTIIVKHIVTQIEIDGKNTLVEADRAKTKSSLRTLPLVAGFKEQLLALREKQEENKKICGKCYNKKFLDYIFVDEMGNLYKPDTVSDNFVKIIKRNGLKKIRFHDLRHSCASLLLANDVPMKQIQEWLGHSDISTTSNIYAHLEYSSKVNSASTMESVLNLPEIKAPMGWQ